VANAILLPAVLEYNALSDTGRYEKLNELIFGQTDHFKGADFINAIRLLLADLGIPQNLQALGVTKDLIPAMAKDAMKSGNILVNPRTSTVEDIEALYLKAF
jgi:alcohol dehydrogenase